MGMVTIIVGAIGATVIALLIEQAKASVPDVARWIVRMAVDRLPEALKEEHEEEWIAVVANTSGPLLKLVNAAGLHIAAIGIASDLYSEQSRAAEAEHQADTASVSDAQTNKTHVPDVVTEKWIAEYKTARNFFVHAHYRRKVHPAQLELFRDWTELIKRDLMGKKPTGKD